MCELGFLLRFSCVCSKMILKDILSLRSLLKIKRILNRNISWRRLLISKEQIFLYMDNGLSMVIPR
ncbi:unnamed protein product [Musa acuminata subsp. malaccensis]|uniref:(wild Malaysian banana) hypothetical protein n=1 Tax=Musa acuminata subsp. malaccensis TaxID=214687 RepID=A0A804KN05_MUSAM|nr:unnamed protein product [Musa acuminata subsp. malaccensis]